MSVANLNEQRIGGRVKCAVLAGHPVPAAVTATIPTLASRVTTLLR